MIGHAVCCFMGLIPISVWVPHFAGQRTVCDVAASCALVFLPTGVLSPFHSRRVHPALSGYDKGLQCLVVETVNLNIVNLFCRRRTSR